jgi:hypothetical protein
MERWMTETRWLDGTDAGNDPAPAVPKTTVMMTTSNDGDGDYQFAG